MTSNYLSFNEALTIELMTAKKFSRIVDTKKPGTFRRNRNKTRNIKRGNK